jgi:hypothetical protein
MGVVAIVLYKGMEKKITITERVYTCLLKKEQTETGIEFTLKTKIVDRIDIAMMMRIGAIRTVLMVDDVVLL